MLCYCLLQCPHSPARSGLSNRTMLESEDIAVYSNRASRAVERMKTTRVWIGHIPDNEEQEFGYIKGQNSRISVHAEYTVPLWPCMVPFIQLTNLCIRAILFKQDAYIPFLLPMTSATFSSNSMAASNATSYFPTSSKCRTWQYRSWHDMPGQDRRRRGKAGWWKVRLNNVR